MIKKLIAALMLLAATTAVVADDTAIKAGAIINPETGEVLKDKVIIISGNRIKDIVDVMPSEGIDKVIDLSDSWVLPGLMDMHSHLSAITKEGDSLTAATIYKDNAYRALIGAEMGKEMLMSGFTTVRDVGNAGDYVDTALRKAFAEGRVPGPRVFNAGKIISVYGGQSGGIAWEKRGLWNQEYIDVVSPDEMKRAIHENSYFGATLIKLVVGDQAYSLSDETLKAAVDEAKSANMKVAMHAWGDEQVKRATLAGAATIEHGFGTTDETFKLMKEKGTYFVGTEFPARYLAIYWDEPSAEAFTKQAVAQLGRAYKIGVPLAFGTDIIMQYKDESRGEMAINYLENWIAADIPAMDTLKAMTISSAKAIGVEKHLGTIEKGKIADIIAVKADPIKDLWALKDVTFVMKSGKRYK